jgi:periplasmic protein TonB
MNALVADTEKPHRTTATLVLELEPPEDAPELPKATHEAGEYKKHSLASGYWGDINQSRAPIRRVGAEEAQATFLRGLLDTPTDHRRKDPTDWVVSLALHILIVGAVVIAPLAFTQVIDFRNLQLTYLTVPRPPAAAPPPAPAGIQQATRRMLRVVRSSLLAPTVIPKRVEIVKDPPAPEISAEGVIGGIPGGEVGGVLGGIIGGTDHAFIAPPPPAGPKQKVYRVGGVVKPPRPITVVQPIYPPLARAAQIQGVVVIDAVINQQGEVFEARAVSGPGLLIPAALKAVIQWKYEPTYLDGEPVAMELEVQVEFHLK